METNLEKAFSKVDRDLSAEWIELSAEVRKSVASLRDKARDSAMVEEISALEANTLRLCDDVERIHRDVEKLLLELDEKIPEIDSLPADVDPEAVKREAIQIHRETHELRADFKDIIKALFMWQDDPVTRARYQK